MTVCLSPKGSKHFSDIISCLLVGAEREVKKWENKFGEALLLREEVSIDQDAPLMTLRFRACHTAPLTIV